MYKDKAMSSTAPFFLYLSLLVDFSLQIASFFFLNSDCCRHSRMNSETTAAAAKNVNVVLKEMRRLRSEMKTLLKVSERHKTK